jgi:hypothetical protein
MAASYGILPYHGRSEEQGEPVSKSRISLDYSEVDDNYRVTEIVASIDRDDELDPELAEQVVIMTPAEMAVLYDRIRQYYEMGVWTTGMVER